MSGHLDRALTSLRDVEGVYGSFLVSFSGRTLARDLPIMFDEQAVAVAAERVARFGEAFEGDPIGLEMSVLRFGDHKLHLRRVSRGFLCVLTALRVNMPTLKMALTLVGRRMASESEANGERATLPSLLPPAPANPAAPPRSSVLPPGGAAPLGPSGRRAVLYRGRRIE